MNGARSHVVVFISGGGSNMVALAEACAAADFPGKIIAVVSDRADAGGLAKAEGLGLPTFVFERRDFDSKTAHEAAILGLLDRLRPDAICLAGYMRLLSADFIRPYEGRILNIHPSLLPRHRGLHTHRRALDAGDAEAGCTVHIVTEGMDEGPVLAQARVPILPGDTAETLAARVLVEEHRLYARTLKEYLRGFENLH